MTDVEFKNNFELIKNNNRYIYFNKIDKQKKVLSGTFTFDLKNKETGEILKIRDGRFDLKMNYTN